MIHWYERLAAPVIGGGSVWLFGVFQGQSEGYQAFIRCAAVFAAGLFALIATFDLFPSWWFNNWPLVAIAWACLVGWFGWKKYLA